jgi:DNA excision repair protein ERCC-3
LRLESESAALLVEIARHKSVKPFLGESLSPHAFHVPLQYHGALKQALIAVGWPVEDLAGYVAGETLEIDLRADRFTLRDYQKDAAEIFYYAGSERGGSGVIVLPCGAGKTIVGLTAMALAGQSTLILTTSRTSVEQWRRELLEKTTLRSDFVCSIICRLFKLILLVFPAFPPLSRSSRKTTKPFYIIRFTTVPYSTTICTAVCCSDFSSLIQVSLDI